jgi:hypothetical protein
LEFYVFSQFCCRWKNQLDFFKRKNAKSLNVQSSNAQTLNAQTSNINVGDTLLSASDISISENSSKHFFKRKNAQSSNAQTSNAQILNVNVGDASSPALLVIHYYQLLISQFLKILLNIFSNEKMHKVQMPKLQMHKF